MRFCMITTFYPPYHFGGDAIYTYRLVNELARRGHTVAVIHCADAYTLLAGHPPRGDFPHEPNVTVHRLHSRFGALSPLATQQTGLPALKAPAMRAIIRDGDFDVLHFHNMSLIGAGGLSYGRADAIRLFTLHEYWLLCPMHMLWKYGRRICERPQCFSCQLVGRRPPQLWRHTPLLRAQLRHVDAFLAPSRFSLRLHQERGLADLPLRVLPYFIAGREVGDDATIVRATETARPYFLFVGRLEEIKGVQVLIEAFRGYPHADLLIAGEGNYGDALRAQAAGLPHVRFLGGRSQAELRPLYRGAIALLVPSIWQEVFGIVALEAFAMRTPVIAHRCGALPEIVAESGGGLTYDTTGELIAALEQLRTDDALRDRLGAAGHAAFERLWREDPHLDAYFALLRDIVDRRGGVTDEGATPGDDDRSPIGA